MQLLRLNINVLVNKLILKGLWFIIMDIMNIGGNEVSTKEEVIKLIENLPNNATIEEIIEQLSVKAEIEKGLNQLNNGKFHSHDEVKEKFAKWLI